MNDTNLQTSTTESTENLSETSVLPSTSSSSPTKILDEEAKQRKIISKLWGKGSKSSHKVRELEKTSTRSDHDSQTNPSSQTSSNDGKLSTDDNSNNINSKPLAVVKPIVMVKSGTVVSSAADRTRVDSEASSSITQPTETAIKQKKSSTNRRSSRMTTSKREESSVDHHRPRSSGTRSPSRSHRHSKTDKDRSRTHRSSSPTKNEHNSTIIATNSQRKDSETGTDNDMHRHKSEKNSSKQSKTQNTSPKRRHSSSTSTNKVEKSKTSTHRDETSSNRHRSKSKEDKKHRKTVHSSKSEDNSNHKHKINQDKESSTTHESSHHDKKSSRDSSIPSTHDEHRRKSSYDHHRHHSPNDYDRRHEYRHYHRSNNTHHYQHHSHHYRSPSPRYHHYRHRRSSSPRSRQHRSRYFSSSSSSFSSSPRRRSLSSRTSSSSSSSRTSTSYSSISPSSSSSSRSSSRRRHHHQKKFRRSPTLEKLFLKASESIEAVSTQRDPNAPSALTTHLIPIQTTATTPINTLPEANSFYSERFSGFSVPPPPFIPQQPPPQHQRYLKEITTDPTTSRRIIYNEQPPTTSSIVDEVSTIKTNQLTELSTIVRSSSTKPPRVSRFSDITPTVPIEPVLNTNLSVDTVLNYIQISDNINCLSSSRRQQKRHNREVMECECTTSEYDRSRGIKACGSECLNRMLLIECSSNCPCGQWCTNRRFQKRSYANHKLALFKTEMKGHGLRTTSSIRKGRFLVEYVGEVVDMDELARRSKKYKRDGNIHQYVMSLIHGTVIDSTMKGNWARFINHSCEPNCVAEKWLVNGEYRMGIFAKRDLISNEEITIDYRFETFGSVDLANEKCYCGAPTCRGTISIKTNNNTNNSNKRQNRRQPIDDDELIEYLRDDDTNEYIIPKTIEEIRQLIQIMSRTDSENVRTIELDLIRNGSQKHIELPRLFLECNGLHVLCSWVKDILIDNQQQDYSIEFKINLLDFIQNILPIKDRTIVIKNGLLELVHQKLKLPTQTTVVNDQQQISDLLNQMLDHLDDPIVSKLFQLYSSWMSLKERFIIPKRKESEQPSSHHHHHHHHRHHSSKYINEENNSRLSFNTRPAMSQLKPIERYSSRRTYNYRDLPRSQEQELSKDERRKLFEQQYEDAEKARAAAAAALNGESPGGQNEPPQKKQRTSDGSDPTASNTPVQPIDQTYYIHQYLSQIPLEYIQSYMTSIGQSTSESNTTNNNKDEPPILPPTRPDDENVLSRIIRLPVGWSVAMCPSDSSVYFYNKETMTSTWIPPLAESAADNVNVLLDLSPLSSAQITEQRRPHSHISSSARSTLKLSKHPHRHIRTHRHNHHHHISSSSSNKRKRPTEIESIVADKESSHEPVSQDIPTINIDEQTTKQEELNEKKSTENIDDSLNIHSNEDEMSTTVKMEDHQSFNSENSNSFKLNRDLLRKNISQHVHITLKPYTKRTCKQGRISTTDDIKYLVKKFTLAVLDKEIEKAKNDRIPLSPILTDRVRLKTEVYVKKYMNKMGPVFQRHDTTGHAPVSSQPTNLPTSENGTSTTATDPE